MLFEFNDSVVEVSRSSRFNFESVDLVGAPHLSSWWPLQTQRSQNEN